jgi:hypothetical protein
MSDDNNLNPDPTRVPAENSGGDVGDILSAIERAAEIDARSNYRVGDNHAKLAMLAVAQVAALKSAGQSEEQLVAAIQELISNPT